MNKAELIDRNEFLEGCVKGRDKTISMLTDTAKENNKTYNLLKEREASNYRVAKEKIKESDNLRFSINTLLLASGWDNDLEDDKRDARRYFLEQNMVIPSDCEINKPNAYQLSLIAILKMNERGE